MKKIIASVLLACFGASILIAEVPAAVAASADPFAGVEGVELTAVEEGEVEGGIYPAVVIASVSIGAATGATLNVIDQVTSGNKKIDMGAVGSAALGGAVTGLVCSTGFGAGVGFTVIDGLALGAAGSVYGKAVEVGTKAVINTVNSNNQSKATPSTTSSSSTSTTQTKKRWFSW